MGVVAGSGWVQRLPTLPTQQGLAPLMVALSTLAIIVIICIRLCIDHAATTSAFRYEAVWRRVIKGGIALLLGLMIGSGWAMWHAQHRLDERLDPIHHDVVTRLVVRIAEIPQRDGRHYRFFVELDKPYPRGFPGRMSVSWQVEGDHLMPDLKPGQVWRMALVVRQPHGLRNPDAYDVEGRLFAMGVLATATVRGSPVFLGDDPWSSPGMVIERLRYGIREGMRHALGDARYAPVMIALAIGDQASVEREDWQIFNRSGITHLVSISGMHVTLIAALGGCIAVFVWRRATWRRVRVAEYVPAQVVGAAAALIVALFYCLLAGWGVPARRTFFMLAIVAGAAMLRLPLSASRILMLAGACVTLLDPWATLAPGFWLSFGAVAILLKVGAMIDKASRQNLPTWPVRIRSILTEFSIVQGAITLGLVPLLAYLMNQISLVSPLVNVYAIPIVSFLVTPLALLCAILSIIPGCSVLAHYAGVVGHTLFEVMMVAVSWMSASPWAVLDIPAAPWPWLLVALAGVAWALQPSGLPYRWVGWLLMLPMLCWRAETILPGYWTMTALDVGQGSAIVVETATQVLLFDTGPSNRHGTDAGERVVIPFFRTRGYSHIDVMVVSHADADHAGGVSSVMAALAVKQAYSSFDLGALVHKQSKGGRISTEAVQMPAAMLPCQAGHTWTIDGVTFSFLHPDKHARTEEKGNAASCVLLIQGKQHGVLLPGDIGVEQEHRVTPYLARVDVVLVPHHGSQTSSSENMVRALKASHAIAQVGYMNRFKHPAPSVQARWVDMGATFWRTDYHGAVTAYSTAHGLRVESQSETPKRYWHPAF